MRWVDLWNVYDISWPKLVSRIVTVFMPVQSTLFYFLPFSSCKICITCLVWNPFKIEAYFADDLLFLLLLLINISLSLLIWPWVWNSFIPKCCIKTNMQMDGNKHKNPLLSKRSCHSHTTIVNMFASSKVNCIYHVWPSGAACMLSYFNGWTCSQIFFFPDCQGNGLWKLIHQLLRALVSPPPPPPSLSLSSNCITSACTDLFPPWAKLNQPESYWHSKAEFNKRRSASANTLDTRS